MPTPVDLFNEYKNRAVAREQFGAGVSRLVEGGFPGIVVGIEDLDIGFSSVARLDLVKMRRGPYLPPAVGLLDNAYTFDYETGRSARTKIEVVAPLHMSNVVVRVLEVGTIQDPDTKNAPEVRFEDQLTELSFDNASFAREYLKTKIEEQVRIPEDKREAFDALFQ